MSKFTFSLGLSGRMGVGSPTPTCSASERVASTTCGVGRVWQLTGQRLLDASYISSDSEKKERKKDFE